MNSLINILKEISIDKPYVLTKEGKEFINDMSQLRKLEEKYPDYIKFEGSELNDQVWGLEIMGFTEFRKLNKSQIEKNVVGATEQALWNESGEFMLKDLIENGYLIQ